MLAKNLAEKKETKAKAKDQEKAKFNKTPTVMLVNNLAEEKETEARHQTKRKAKDQDKAKYDGKVLTKTHTGKLAKGHAKRLAKDHAKRLAMDHTKTDGTTDNRRQEKKTEA